MVTSFFNLKNIITKACSVTSDAKDYAEKHCFKIDTSMLDNMFFQKKLDYHVMAGTTTLKSYIPYVSDIHTVADYVETYDDLMEIMDGYTQIVIFTIFATHNTDGKITIGEDEETEFSNRDLFIACNHEKKMDMSLMGMIEKQFPIYKVLVARKFSTKDDAFVYDIYFRSNGQMTALYRSLAEKKDKKKEEAE